MRIISEITSKVIELDKRYRSSWDTRSIAHITGISHGSVAKILAQARGLRPKPKHMPHTCKTRFFKRDVMWSSDFIDLPGGRYLIKTLDEMSLYRPGWLVAESESAQTAVRHGEDLIACMGRAPLVWKYDHGSAFTSKAFQRFLNKYGIIGYPIRARAPWTNGRVERDHQEIQNWLIPVNKDINLKEMEKEVDEGMLMLNNIKPRAVLIYRTSAEVYFHSDGVEEVDRVLFAAELEGIKQRLWPLTGERLHRKAVRELLKKRLLYEEWDEANKEAKSANRIEAYNVSF